MIAEAWNVNRVESVHMCQYFQTLAKTSLLLLHFLGAHENAQIVRHTFSTLFFQNLHCRYRVTTEFHIINQFTCDLQKKVYINTSMCTCKCNETLDSLLRYLNLQSPRNFWFMIRILTFE